MTPTEKMLTRLPTMDATQRKNLRANLNSRLEDKPKDTDALRLLAALDELEPEKGQGAGLVRVGGLDWEPHRADRTQFQGFHNGQPVALIHKRANHTATDKDVYTVQIMGTDLPGSFAQVNAAREAGSVAYMRLN